MLRLGRITKPIGGRSGAIHTINRGTISIAGATAAGTASITAVDTARAHLLSTGFSTTTGTAWDAGDYVLTNSTTITVTRISSTGPDGIYGYSLTERWA